MGKRGALCCLFRRHACEALTPLPGLLRGFCVDRANDRLVPALGSWSFVKPGTVTWLCCVDGTFVLLEQLPGTVGS